MDSKLTFGGVVVSTPHPQKDPVVRRTYAATELTPSSMLHTVELRISVNPPPDTKVYTVFGGQAVDLAAGKEFVLSVPVRWKGNLPHTRERGVDNVDAWIVGADGTFTDYQISVATRRGEFFATIQTLFAGQVTRTRGDRVGSVKYDTIPLESFCAYPGCDFESVWRPMARELERVARDLGSSEQLARVREKAAKWAPKYPPAKQGWKSATVLYYNAVTGTGRVRTDGGEECFVHFSKVAGESPLRLLEPETAVHVQIAANSDPNRLASVVSLKVAHTA